MNSRFGYGSLIDCDKRPLQYSGRWFYVCWFLSENGLMASIKSPSASVSHHAAEVAELAADKELAAAYLKAAFESLDNPDERAGGLLAIRAIAEGYGGLSTVAESGE